MIWRDIKAHFDRRIEELRSELETPLLDQRRADHVRGQLQVAREILTLPDTEARNAKIRERVGQTMSGTALPGMTDE